MICQPAVNCNKNNCTGLVILLSAANLMLEVNVHHSSAVSGAVCTSLHSFGHWEALERNT